MFNCSLSLVFMCNWKIFVSDFLIFSSAYSTLLVENKFSVYLNLFMDRFVRSIVTFIGNWINVFQNLNKIIPQFLHQICGFIKLSASVLLYKTFCFFYRDSNNWMVIYLWLQKYILIILWKLFNMKIIK